MFVTKWSQAFGKSCGCISQRYLLTFMSLLGIVITYILRVCLNMAITKMISNPKDNKNDTNAHYISGYECGGEPLDWDEKAQGVVLGSFYIGYVIAHLPGAYLSRKIGGKYVFGIGIIGSSLFSFLSPVAACYSSGALTATRIAMGLTEGPTFPALSELLSQWAPPNERTLLSSIAFAGVQIGTVVSMIVTGYMLDEIAWPNVFYILGCTGVVWFFFWVILCYNSPSTHPFISISEKNYLKETIPETEKKMPTPWKAMLTSGPLWALIIAEIGHDYALYTFVTELPKYYHDLTKMSFTQNGVVSALPYLIMWITSVLLGYMSDKLIQLNLTSVTILRRTLSTIGAIAPGIGIVCASVIAKEDSLIIILTVSLAFMACCYSSIRVNPLDLSPNHAATIMAIVNGLGAVSGFVAPTIVGAVISSDSVNEIRIKQWHTVFWIVFAVLVLSSIPFLVFGSGNIQPWDRPEPEHGASDLRRRSTLSGGDPIREKYKNYYPEQPTIKE